MLNDTNIKYIEDNIKHIEQVSEKASLFYVVAFIESVLDKPSIFHRVGYFELIHEAHNFYNSIKECYDKHKIKYYFISNIDSLDTGGDLIN